MRNQLNLVGLIWVARMIRLQSFLRYISTGSTLLSNIVVGIRKSLFLLLGIIGKQRRLAILLYLDLWMLILQYLVRLPLLIDSLDFVQQLLLLNGLQIDIQLQLIGLRGQPLTHDLLLAMVCPHLDAIVGIALLLRQDALLHDLFNHLLDILVSQLALDQVDSEL